LRLKKFNVNQKVISCTFPENISLSSLGKKNPLRKLTLRLKLDVDVGCASTSKDTNLDEAEKKLDPLKN